ncbi:cryptochrome/photolyase family protein [Aquimarina agarilytica]|uniref:cryptochrome/photolyase family protein n=1 Tax=Aquimarina agarilytica TaxID=1087449 RepID=UPI00028A16BC|nr:deoxyribodipyrimidine photo-lyase [Aquimarina agarilytica]
MTDITIFWFRRDLRLTDNTGLFFALSENKNVLPIFIFDTEILNSLPKKDARLNFIYDSLLEINLQLNKENKGISLYHGKPLDIFKQLCKEINITSVYTNHDYEPYAQNRDTEIADFLNTNGIPFKTYKDQVYFEKNEIVKADGSPYMVYTPYKNKWKDLFKTTEFIQYPSEDYLANIYEHFNYTSLSLELLGFEKSDIKVLPFTATPSLIEGYEDTRNIPSNQNGTSKLGPHLRFGTVSIREMIKKAIAQKNEVFWSELIWREFFMQILWHFPHTQHACFKPKYDRIQWRNNEMEFEKWKKGETGYPLVDAGIRELNTTGYMHNRVRMLVGSFLCKHLLIDWRWGEAYFAEKLLDYELSSNIGNWQWVAGTGVDAAPYFRIFNPTTQIQKFDKQHIYIKRWVKDLNELTYPTPMVDHKMARERCLSTYKLALT